MLALANVVIRITEHKVVLHVRGDSSEVGCESPSLITAIAVPSRGPQEEILIQINPCNYGDNCAVEVVCEPSAILLRPSPKEFDSNEIWEKAYLRVSDAAVSEASPQEKDCGCSNGRSPYLYLV